MDLDGLEIHPAPGSEARGMCFDRDPHESVGEQTPVSEILPIKVGAGWEETTTWGNEDPMYYVEKPARLSCLGLRKAGFVPFDSSANRQHFFGPDGDDRDEIIPAYVAVSFRDD